MMSENKEDQFTVQGADPPVPVGVAGERAGPAQPSASNCSVSPVGNQAGDDAGVTGREEGHEVRKEREEDTDPAFNRSRRIARTPPQTRPRVNSLPEKGVTIPLIDLSSEEARRNDNSDKIPKHSRLNLLTQLKRCTSAEARKRKIMDTSLEASQGGAKRKENSVAADICGAIETMLKHFKEMEKRIQENPNTKREIKEAAVRMRRCAEVLESSEARKWLEECKRTPTDTRSIACQASTEPLRTEASTQTEPAPGTRAKLTAEAVREKLAGPLTPDDLRELFDKRWPEEAFIKCKLENEGRGVNGQEVDIVICKASGDWDHPLIKNYLRRNPEIDPAMIQKNDQGESVYGVRRTAEVFGDEAPGVLKKDRLSVLIKTEGDDKTKDDERLFQAFGKVVSLDGISKELSVTISTTLREESRVRKHAEYAFRDYRGKVVLKTYKMGNKQTVPQKVKGDDRNTYAMIVESKNRGSSFRETLTQVKMAIGCSETRKAVKTLRSTKDGKVLIVLDKSEEACERVQDILSNSGNLGVKRTGDSRNQEMIHIRGMDALATKDDIVAALEEKLGSLRTKAIRIGELRPNMRDTLAATVSLPKEDAEVIERLQTLRIGMVNCKAERRINLPRCFKCWAYDHKAANCKGDIDRSKDCYSCGKTGHGAKNCAEPPWCPICNSPGHKADSAKCPAFRKALSVAKREASRATAENFRVSASSQGPGAMEVASAPESGN